MHFSPTAACPVPFTCAMYARLLWSFHPSFVFVLTPLGKLCVAQRANACLLTPRSCRQSGLAGRGPSASATTAGLDRAQLTLVCGTSMPALALCVERRAYAGDGASRRGRGAALTLSLAPILALALTRTLTLTLTLTRSRRSSRRSSEGLPASRPAGHTSRPRMATERASRRRCASRAC